MSKPAYSPLMMADVLAAEGSSGLKVASTFAGAGGSCLGYRLAGYSLVWANEFEPTAAETYKLNAQEGCILDQRDIRTVRGEEILEATGLQRGELDLFDGSPPCQSFSTAGKREKGWGKSIAHADGTTQRSDDLFEEYVRLVREVQPRVFVAENVTGLVKGTAKGYFKRLLVWMREAGYDVECRIVDSRWLGVPQARQRAIFVGVRNDIAAALGKVERYPKPASWFYSVADACPWIVSHGRSMDLNKFAAAGRDVTGTFIRSDQAASPTIPATVGGLGGVGTCRAVIIEHNYSDREHLVDQPAPTIQSFMQQRIGPAGRAVHYTGAGSFMSAPAVITDKPSPIVTIGVVNSMHFGVQAAAAHPQTLDPIDSEIKTLGASALRAWMETKVGESHPKNFSTVRAAPEKPAPTINASHGIVTRKNEATMHGTDHPYEPRRFTILEVKRLCSFPDDFQMVGKFEQRWARLGNAVPPLMMRAVAATIRDNVLLPFRARAGARCGSATSSDETSARERE